MYQVSGVHAARSAEGCSRGQKNLREIDSRLFIPELLIFCTFCITYKFVLLLHVKFSMFLYFLKMAVVFEMLSLYLLFWRIFQMEKMSPDNISQKLQKMRG